MHTVGFFYVSRTEPIVLSIKFNTLFAKLFNLPIFQPQEHFHGIQESRVRPSIGPIFPPPGPWTAGVKKVALPDLMVIDTKGKLGPAGKVFHLWLLGIEDVRSRYLVGYAIGSGLNSDLVRGAFLNAIKTTSRIIPRTVQMDDGMENAAKEITGGTPWRRRGKVKDDEIIGLFPKLGIDVSWATLAHGQAKQVERLFGTLSQLVETRPEFWGAYCGNSPEARPEEWDMAKAVPLELVEAILREEITAHHNTPHRGQSMNKRSPLQVYMDEGAKPGVPLRRITEPQVRILRHHSEYLDKDEVQVISRLIEIQDPYARNGCQLRRHTGTWLFFSARG